MQLDALITALANSFFVSMFAILALFVYWNVLYWMLKKKYDPLLFKEPFFNKNEIEVFSVWPFSLVKATAYILLIANYSVARKRFKNFENPVNESAPVKFFCHLLIIATLIFGSIFLVGIILGLVDMLTS